MDNIVEDEAMRQIKFSVPGQPFGKQRPKFSSLFHCHIVIPPLTFLFHRTALPPLSPSRNVPVPGQEYTSQKSGHKSFYNEYPYSPAFP